MRSSGDEPSQRRGRGRSSIQEKVAKFYYTMGLFCTTYPFTVLFMASIVIVICWLPLLNLHFPGKAPLMRIAPINSSILEEHQPFCYIQQVIMRVGVMPWDNEMKLGDAFRGPLYEVFKVLEVVRNYQDESSSKSLGHLCLHIEATKRTIGDQANVLPQYSCLVLSPANLWNQDVQQFSQDPSILHTIYNHHSIQKGKISIAEMLFGMHLFDTGIKRYPLKNKQRILQYAVTLFLKEYDQEFIDGLKKKLISIYPLHHNTTKSAEVSGNKVVIIQYSGELKYIELIPICAAFVLIFFYYYYSVRKMNMITSKLGMAFTATWTIFCNLTMTMGICFFFGFSLPFNERKGILPYVALLIGLENALVLTKSVTSTPFHLDIKIRTAQCVSKEGWSITKNILLEITVLTIGLFTFVPAIQELCIFSIVALITDFYLQMFCFFTILGLDISRTTLEKTNNSLYQPFNLFEPHPVKALQKSRSHPRLSTYPANIIANQAQSAQQQKIPKRVRLVNVWARTRFFQRSFMILMIVWIGIILYHSDIMNHFLVKILNDNSEDSNTRMENNTSHKWSPLINANSIPVNYVTYRPIEVEYQRNLTQDIEKLKYSDSTPWNGLSARLWPAIFRNYNISLRSQIVVILPNIKLSHVVRPEQVALLRNPNEKYGNKLQWQALAAALDPLDFRDARQDSFATKIDQPFFPTSPMEIFLTTILCIISVVVLAYILVVIYRCVCSRNYAEWRTSWNKDKVRDDKDEHFLLEAVPMVVEGHHHQIECLATDGKRIISACLGGQLKLWDANTGELVFSVDRKSIFLAAAESSPVLEENVDVFEPGSPSKDITFPKLLNKINTDFSSNINSYGSSPTSKSDFDRSYRYFYSNHEHEINHRQRDEVVRKVSASDIVKNSKDFLTRTKSDSENNFLKYSDNSENAVLLTRRCSNCDIISDYALSQIWCIDYLDNLIVAGCADGRLEFWEVNTNKLKGISNNETESGITHLKIVGSKIIVVRLCGTLELYQLQSRNQGGVVDYNFSCAYRRTHVRTGSVGSMVHDKIHQPEDGEELNCQKLHSIKAHQQSINCLDSEGGRIVTGSQDHTLKVFRLEDAAVLCRLHGHSGPITSLFIDRLNPAMSGSASQDGMLCVWDLMTGACMYSIQAHNGSITSLTYSTSYVISLGTDDRLCIWERFQGHLLNTINIAHTFSNQILMLGQHLVVTGKNGGLVIWDVRNGECVKSITLGRAPFVFINHLILLPDAVLCDYGKQLRIIRFPSISHKFD